MEMADRESCRHENAAPSHRADPGQPDFDLEDRVAIRHHRRRFSSTWGNFDCRFIQPVYRISPNPHKSSLL
jgi:hypothetical protein